MPDISILEDFDFNGDSVLIPTNSVTPDATDANAVTTPTPIVIDPASSGPSATTPDATAVVTDAADAHSVTTPDPIIFDPASATTETTDVAPVGIDASFADSFVPSLLHISLNDGWMV